MADIGGIQLLPGTRKELAIKKTGENKFLYIGMGILAAIVATGLGLTFYKMSLSSEISTLDEGLNALEAKRDSKTEDNLKVLNAQVSVISNLIKNHIFISRAIDKLGSLLSTDIQVIKLSISVPDQRLTMSMAAKNYTAVARQMASFLSDETFKEISLGPLSTATTGEINFDMNMIFDKVKLIKK